MPCNTHFYFAKPHFYAAISAIWTESGAVHPLEQLLISSTKEIKSVFDIREMHQTCIEMT